MTPAGSLSRRDRAAMERDRKARNHAKKLQARIDSLPPDDCEWRPVVGLEGRYEVTADGRVRSMLTRVARYYKAEVRSRVGTRGYLVVSLRLDDGRTRCATLHTLVARAFIGPPPEGTEVAHEDGDRTNPHLSNLRYATPKENQADRLRHGTGRSGDANPSRTRPERLARGERNGWAKLDESTIRAIRADAALGQRKIGRKYNISKSTAWAIVNRKAWRHVA